MRSIESDDWWNAVMSEPLHIEKGMAITNGATGSCVAWNEAMAEKFSV